jgi:hypothetical protein
MSNSLTLHQRDTHFNQGKEYTGLTDAEEGQRNQVGLVRCRF